MISLVEVKMFNLSNGNFLIINEFISPSETNHS